MRITSSQMSFSATSGTELKQSSLSSSSTCEDLSTKNEQSSRCISFGSPDQTTKETLAPKQQQKSVQNLESQVSKGILALLIAQLNTKPKGTSRKVSLTAGSDSTSESSKTATTEPASVAKKNGSTEPVSKEPAVSQRVLNKLDYSEFNSPKALERWNGVVGHLPPGEREAKARELNRPIAAAKMLREGGADKQAAQAYIDANPALKTALDTGEGKGKADGKTTKKDISCFTKRMERNAEKASDMIKKYQKDNPESDPQALASVRSSATLLANSALLMAADPDKAVGAKNQKESHKKNLHIEDLQAIADNNPTLASSFREAANTWSDPGMFTVLGHGALKGKDIARHGYDDILWIEDIEGWIKDHSPKNSSNFTAFMDKASTFSAVADVDTTDLNKDIFDNPNKYQPEQKAGVLVKLYQTEEQLIAGRSIRNTEESEEEVQQRITQLESDPRVEEFMKTRKNAIVKSIISGDSTLRKANQNHYGELASG